MKQYFICENSTLDVYKSVGNKDEVSKTNENGYSSGGKQGFLLLLDCCFVG